MIQEKAILESVAREIEALPGHLGLYYKNLSSGYTFGIRENEAYLAASVIKFPLLLHYLRESAEGNLSLDQVLTIGEAEKMPSCGAVSLFSGSVSVDIRTLCRLMIAISDNTATNVLIRYAGMEEVNRTFRQLGMEKTVLRRLLFDSDAAARGLENTISPKEMGMLLEKLYLGEFVCPDVSRQAIDILLLQQIEHKLDGKLQGEVPIAHKTGEDSGLSNDIGILFAPEPFILCFAGHDTDCYFWEDLIRRTAYDLVHCQYGPENCR